MATTISSGTNPYKLGSPPDFGTLYSGRALEFDGVTDYITVAETLFTGEFTFSVWIYPDALSNEYISTTSDGEDYFNLIDANTTKTKIGNSTDTWDSGAVFVTSQWQHLVLTRDSDNALTIYLDGVSYTSNQPTRSGTFTFQYLGGLGSNLFEGKMSNVQLWDKAWSLSDVQYAYTHPEKLITHNSAVTSGTTISNLKAWYPCTEGNPRSPQTTVYDGSPKELGSNLWDSPASVFTSGTYAWTVYGTNTIANDSNALKITYDNDSRGAYVWLKDASDLSTDLTIGKTYKFTFDAKVESGDSVPVKISTLAGSPATVTETDFTTKTIYFTAENTDSTYVEASTGSGEIIWLDNLSLKEVTHDLVSYWALDETIDEFPAIKTTVSDLVTTTLGSDLLGGRGSFTNNDDTFWTIETGASGTTEITGGELVFTGKSGGYRVKRTTLTPEFTLGRTYKIQVECTDYTSGACFIDLNQVHLNTTASYAYFYGVSTNKIDSVGIHTYYWTASAITNHQIAITPGTTSTMKLDNFTVQEVNGNPGTLI